MNLNRIELPSDSDNADNPFRLRVTDQVHTKDVSVYFDGIEDALVQHIERYDAVFGCVAWLTNARILNALAQKYVSIVVQKEDFLKPDKYGDKTTLQRQYAAMKHELEKFFLFDVPTPVEQLSVCGDPTLWPIRCLGNHNSDKRPAWPRMHHKFAVFATFNQEKGSEDEPSPIFIPRAVWTGSFNWSATAAQSMENAVVIRTRSIVDAYVQEWGRAYSLSEPLDWETPWMEPEYRLGT